MRNGLTSQKSFGIAPASATCQKSVLSSITANGAEKQDTANLGVTVKALRQIWRTERAIDVSQCRKLSTSADFWVLDDPYSLYDKENNTSEVVYADFIVTDWWEYQEPIHGGLETWVTVESLYGEEYTLRHDPMMTPYEFGIGEKYTIFIYYNYGNAKISYAIQLDY